MSNCWGTFMTVLTAERGTLVAPKAVLQWTKEGVQALGSAEHNRKHRWTDEKTMI